MSEFRPRPQSSRDRAQLGRKSIADEEGAANSWRHRSAPKVEKHSHHAQPRKETYLIEDFINSIGRLFGFKDNRTTTRHNTTEHHEPSNDSDRETELATRPVDQEKEDGEEESDRHIDDSLEGETDSVPASTGKRRNENRNDGLSTDGSSFEDEEESMRTSTEAHGSQNVAEPKDGHSDLSDADLLEMAKLFQKFFSSIEKTLKERSIRGTSRALPPSSRGWSGWSSQLQSSESIAEEGASNDEPLSKWGIHRQSLGSGVVHSAKDELPDVHTALAHAESMNRQRDVERRTKFTEEDGTDVGVSPKLRERSRHTSRETRGGGVEEDEELPADVDVEQVIRDVPKSAPSYGARKRLLRSRERGDEEREGKTLTEWLVDGLQSML